MIVGIKSIYFAIRDDGTIYFLSSFNEDSEEQCKYLKEILCIKRITENLIFSSNYYSNLEVPSNSEFSIRIKNGNLQGRTFLFELFNFYKEEKSVISKHVTIYIDKWQFNN